MFVDWIIDKIHAHTVVLVLLNPIYRCAKWGTAKSSTLPSVTATAEVGLA